MGAEILHDNATVMCSHGGSAKPTKVSQKVKVDGKPVATLGPPYTISGCGFPPPPAGAGPCVTASWSSEAQKVKAEGSPVLIKSSSATCTPTGASLSVASCQTKVKAT